MTEAELNKIPVDALFNLLIKTTKELIDFNCEQHGVEYNEKKSEVQLIQRVIIAKRKELKPLL